MFMARAVWRHKEFQLKALDELEMATLRLRLQLPGEIIEKDEKVWKIRPEDVPIRRQELYSESVQSKFNLEKSKSQLRYLLNMDMGRSTRSSDDKTASQKTHRSIGDATCLICHDKLSSHEYVAILDCGHSFCVPCTDRLKEVQRKRGMTKVVCPTCRQRSDAVKVAVTTEECESKEKIVGTQDAESSENRDSKQMVEPKSVSKDVKVKGSFGSKMEGVVDTLLKLEAEDPTMKAVIFSQWNEVLSILQHALVKNDIPFIRMESTSKFDLNLFRKDPAIKCLLLPVKRANHGLNLVEANHCFFVEPLLNPAVDLQAVSRIHRISQTRDVHVHRFIIKDTIEEKIYSIMQKKKVLLTGESAKETAHVSEADLNELFDIKSTR
mmetsp:Transcript_1737/g.2213  ORF Transcript_1737/g.2213 Transcript_1737/m.2213 type:complete len:381 (+) Transcript_1737:3-1145(+)